jgi:LDH2 family malate/lactate/ureidoglycolate dehydrogenase
VDLEERTFGQWWQVQDEFIEVPVNALREFGIIALMAGGASRDDATFIANVLLDKTIQGDHTRGVGNLPAVVRRARSGELDLSPPIRVLRDHGATALLDGGPKAATYLVARAGMSAAIDKARVYGIGWVAVRSPATMLTAHVMQAVDAGMVGIAMTQAHRSVAATGGRGPLFGNAPIAFGIPGANRDPVILDMSLTQTSASGIKLAARQGVLVPEGFILDDHGRPTRDPSEFPAIGYGDHERQRSRGSLTPLGNSHKGYAMVFVVGLLTTVLADANAAWEVDDVALGMPTDGGRFGALMAAIDLGAFGSPTQLRSRVDAFIDFVKASPRRSDVDEILYPGERSQRLRAERKAADVCALPIEDHRALAALAEQLNLPAPPGAVS